MDKILVIKCGGSIINNQEELHGLINNILQLKKSEYKIVLVHGGGPDINQLCNDLHIKSEFVDGLRVTSEEVLTVTQMALLGKTNNNLVYKLNLAGVTAIGLSGHDNNLLIAGFTNKDKFGFVGDVKKVNTKLIFDLLALDLTPVIAPISIDGTGNTLNVNADLVASVIASNLKANKLILLSDIDGYYANYKDKNTLVAKLTVAEIEQLLYVDKNIAGGMIPKLTSCLDAVNGGVNSAHIVNGNTTNAILQTVLHPHDIGTIVLKD
jgi:acetylglutamate kinase